jgi:hypothetical protein
MKKILEFFRQLQRDAAIEAAKLTFSIIGVGSVLADFSVMRLWLLLPAAALLSATWFVIYKQCQ